MENDPDVLLILDCSGNCNGARPVVALPPGNGGGAGGATGGGRGGVIPVDRIGVALMLLLFSSWEISFCWDTLLYDSAVVCVVP